MNVVERINRIKKEKASELKECGIVDSDFDYYFSMNENEAVIKLRILEQQLDNMFHQDKIMARHASSGKFGDDSNIDLSNNE